MRSCVIFNPSARGDKARHFRHQLDVIGARCDLKATTCAGDARRLAAQAVGEGFELVIAAGGDGTVNETLNGIGDVPGGFDHTRLGVLPLGTVNVFARELKIPPRVDAAWAILQRGRETRIDLPRAEFAAGQGCYFAQLAGAGLDARAIELVNWPLKKKIGPFAYVIAGLKALREVKPMITVRAADGQTATGEMVLLGNGRLYGGSFPLLPRADLRDGLLDVCVLPRATWLALIRCAPGFLLRGRLPASQVRHLQSATFELSSPNLAGFELDGEWVGNLPVKFSVERERLRVIVP